MILEVGKKYNELIGQEGSVLNLTGSGFMLKLMYKMPSGEEIKNITKGKVQYKVVYIKNVIMLLVKFGDEMWMDVPFFGDKNTLEVLPKLEDSGTGYTMNVLLSDAKTGELKGIRVFALNNAVSKNLYKFIEHQSEKNYSQRECDQALGYIYSRYSTNNLLNLAIASGKEN